MMKIQTLILSILILSIIALVSYWLSKSDTNKTELNTKVGEKLLNAEYLTGITDIILENITDEKKVHIVKNDKGTWVLPGYYFLPVEFSKLDNFISSLLKADILRYVTSKKERIERLEFSKHKIILKVNEETVWSIETGKRGQSGGLFIQFNNEADVYLVDITSYFDSNVDNWPEKQMLPFKPSDVATLSIDFSNHEHGFKVKRETAESDFLSDGLAENEILDYSSITRFMSTLINARFTKVYELNNPDAITAKDHSHLITFELFNGKIYNLRVGRRPIEISTKSENEIHKMDNNESKDEEELEEPKPGPVFIFFECSDPKDNLNAIMKNVSLSYSNYVFTQIPESRDKFIESSSAPP